MKFDEVVRRGGKSLRTNSPLLLSVATGTGLATTAYLSARAGYSAADIIREDEGRNGSSDSSKQRFKERARLTWKLYIPAASSGGITVLCLVGSARVHARRVAAAQTAYSLATAAFEQYRGKVAEQLGVGKEQAVRDSIAQSRVGDNPPQPGLIIATGKVLCFEAHTGRYFECDMETLRRAENTINQRIFGELYCPLGEFYWEVGLPETSQSSEIGWEAGRPLKLEFSSVLTKDGKPCLTFEYNYLKTL